MKKLTLLTVALLTWSTGMHAQIASWTVEFNWANPSSLKPSYPAPTADNRYGDYIGGVNFEGNMCTLRIDDTNVSQQSQRARFLYGYVTQTVEMRAYPSSVITITPEANVLRIQSVTFTGAKATPAYIVPIPDERYELEYHSTQDGNSTTWYCTFNGVPIPMSPDLVKFSVIATINCTGTSVVVDSSGGVDDITADEAGEGVWYTLQGVRLAEEPTEAGLYLCRRAGKVSKVMK